MSRTAGILTVFALLPATAFGGRPLFIDDAETVGRSVWEVEGGITYWSDPGRDHMDFPFAVTYGVLPALEFGLGFGGQLEQRIEQEGADSHVGGLGDLVIAGKWKFLAERAFSPAQALAMTVKLPTADHSKGLGSGEVDWDFSWIASKRLTEAAGVHVNVGYSGVGDPPDEESWDLLHYGFAADYQITSGLQWVGELFAQSEVWHRTETFVQCNSGFRWAVMDGLMLDAAAGTYIHGDGRNVLVTFGLTWAFDCAARKE